MKATGNPLKRIVDIGILSVIAILTAESVPPLICEDACLAAKAAGARISCDLNYRKNFWDTKAAGLPYALGNKFDPQQSIEYTAAASCLKHPIELDVNLSTVDEIMQLVKGDGSGRVQR